MNAVYLRGDQPRARWKRLDTAQILKRFFFCERALIVGSSAWIPHLADLEIKLLLPYLNWQNAETANALRNRVFELRYPNRLMEQEGADKPLAQLLARLREAPGPGAFLQALATVALPALERAYAKFLEKSDPLADAPTHRFLKLSRAEKADQIAALRVWADREFCIDPNRSRADAWVEAFASGLEGLGGIDTDVTPPEGEVEPIPGSRPLVAPERPARDPRYWPCRFYWPDNIDPNFPYGEGLALQLRSAISHLNEVWAVEHGGIILTEFAEALHWEWIYDAARWTYDESRHCRMGQIRLAAWGFDPAEIPLGSYIYQSANGADPICRLGMLYFFETKNIGRKPERTAAFKTIGDAASEHDMDFDWADETIHAAYGNRWLRALHEKDPSRYPAPDEVRKRCEALVRETVAGALEAEKAAITERAGALLKQAAILAGGSAR